MKKVITIKWLLFFQRPEGVLVLLPFLGNVLFGLVNIYCFSIAIKSIPTATALAAWMGITLAGVCLTDIIIFRQPFNFSQVFFLVMILVGIIGLKAKA